MIRSDLTELLEIKRVVFANGSTGDGLFAKVDITEPLVLPYSGAVVKLQDSGAEYSITAEFFSAQQVADVMHDKMVDANVGTEGLGAQWLMASRINEPCPGTRPNAVFVPNLFLRKAHLDASKRQKIPVIACFVYVSPLKRGQQVLAYYGPNYPRTYEAWAPGSTADRAAYDAQIKKANNGVHELIPRKLVFPPPAEEKVLECDNCGESKLAIDFYPTNQKSCKLCCTNRASERYYARKQEDIEQPAARVCSVCQKRKGPDGFYNSYAMCIECYNSNRQIIAKLKKPR